MEYTPKSDANKAQKEALMIRSLRQHMRQGAQALWLQNFIDTITEKDDPGDQNRYKSALYEEVLKSPDDDLVKEFINDKVTNLISEDKIQNILTEKSSDRIVRFHRNNGRE